MSRHQKTLDSSKIPRGRPSDSWLGSGRIAEMASGSGLAPIRGPLMRRALPIAAGLLLLTTTAGAQSITSPSVDRAVPVGAQMPTRINVGMNISQRIPTSSIDEQREVERAVRRRLYEMAMEAMDECRMLIDVFKAECKISS